MFKRNGFAILLSLLIFWVLSQGRMQKYIDLAVRGKNA